MNNDKPNIRLSFFCCPLGTRTIALKDVGCRNRRGIAEEAAFEEIFIKTLTKSFVIPAWQENIFSEASFVGSHLKLAQSLCALLVSAKTPSDISTSIANSSCIL